MNKIIQVSVVFFFVAVVTNSFFFFRSSKSSLINKYKNKDKLIVFGDIGYYNNTLRKLIQVGKSFMNNNDKMILMGDNFYDNGVSGIDDDLWSVYKIFFKDIPSTNIYSIMGNHDYHKNPKCQINNNYWSTPNFYYKLNFDNVDLFFIDTVQLYPGHCNITTSRIEHIHNKNINTIEHNQLTWLDNELSTSKKKKIVFGHYPIISNGVYNDKLEPIYDVLLPIFKKNNVDAYISGHEHNIQYINKQFDYFNLKQFIIGSSAENRIYEYKYLYHYDMYDNIDNYIMIIYNENNRICVDFVNGKYQLKYKYIL